MQLKMTLNLWSSCPPPESWSYRQVPSSHSTRHEAQGSGHAGQTLSKQVRTQPLLLHYLSENLKQEIPVFSINSTCTSLLDIRYKEHWEPQIMWEQPFLVLFGAVTLTATFVTTTTLVDEPQLVHSDLCFPVSEMWHIAPHLNSHFHIQSLDMRLWSKYELQKQPIHSPGPSLC